MGPSASEQADGPGPAPIARAVAVIPVLSDNYVFVLHDGQRAVVVDPAVAPPVIAWLEARQLALEAVLQTHHHSDHIGGTPELLRRWPAASVIAAAADRDRIPFQTLGVGDGDVLQLLGRRVEVLTVPGHTRAHVAYLLPAMAGAGGELFCGDTLFAGGCGRLFEGTAAQMHSSLQRLAALPEDTRVWCAHEYTEANLRWAASMPGAPVTQAAIAERLAEVRRQRGAGEPTIPTTIGRERATNLFLRAVSAGELASLRASKDHWRG